MREVVLQQQSELRLAQSRTPALPEVWLVVQLDWRQRQAVREPAVCFLRVKAGRECGWA